MAGCKKIHDRIKRMKILSFFFFFRLQIYRWEYMINFQYWMAVMGWNTVVFVAIFKNKFMVYFFLFWEERGWIKYCEGKNWNTSFFLFIYFVRIYHFQWNLLKLSICWKVDCSMGEIIHLKWYKVCQFYSLSPLLNGLCK